MILRQKIYDFLRWSEKYTGTDMIYLVRGGSWLTFGKAVEALSGLGIMVLFGFLISKETFGAYQYILSIAAIVGIFSLYGIDTALIRTVARGNEKMLVPCFKTKLKWGSIGGLISLIISFWYFSQQNFQLGLSFLIVALSLPFINALLVSFSFWQGKKRFDVHNKYYIFYCLLSAFLLAAAIVLTKNLPWLVLGHFLGFAVAGFIIYKLTVKNISQGEEEKETISFGKHLTLMNAAVIISTYIDKIIIWKFLGPISVAIYTFAERPVLKFKNLAPISALALPKLSQSNIKEIKKGLLKKFLKLFSVAGLLALIYILICPYIFKIIFPEYLNSIIFSQVLAIILIFSPFDLLSTSFLAAMKKKELYLIQTVAPILKIILFLILIPLFQIWGAVFSVLISQTLNGLLILYFFLKI